MRKRPYLAFLAFNAAFFMLDTVASYFSIYLDQLGFTRTMIGTVTSVSSFAAMLLQPVGGAMADRSAFRRRTLQGLILITAVLYPLLLLNHGFFYILILYSVYFVFRRMQPAIATALSVEYAEENRRDYGPIRMMGAVGYTLMMTVVSVVAGTENGVQKTFALYSAICLGNVLLLCWLPSMPGHNRTRGGRVSPLSLVHNKGVLLLILFHALLSVANGLGHTYFAIFVTDDMGADRTLYGLMVSVGSLLEIPFLFLADRIIRRLSARRTLILLGVLTAVRWGNAHFAASAGQLFFTQGLNFVNILEGVVITLLISRQVRPEVKTTALALITTVQGVVGTLISSLVGGILADRFGIRPLFLISACFALGTTVLFPLFLRRIPLPEQDQSQMAG